MKTPQEKLALVLKLSKAQNDLLALHYKLDKTQYTEEQLARFTRLEKARDEAIKEIEEALCTCEDYGFIGNHYCPIHVKTEG
jgi:ribosomal 50S subunit-associated protein YjgA (DUF615 family)